MRIWCQFKVFVFVYILIYTAAAETEQGTALTNVIRKSLIATAKSCMNHVNATQEDLELLRKDPPYPEKSSCIIMCLLEKVGIVKNNRYSKSGFMMAVSPIVLTRKKQLDHMRTVSENCDKEVNHEDVTPCLLGNEIVTCIYKYAPELHMKS